MNNYLINPPKKLIRQKIPQSTVHTFNDIDFSLDPIYIGSDNEFSQMASQMNWLGNGTKDNPYVIKDLILLSTEWETLIEIRYTSAHFIITNCTITGGETGITLGNLANGIVENNTIKFSMEDGIRLDQVSNNRIKNNKIYNNSYNGIRLDSSHQNLIKNNSVFYNTYGMMIFDSWRNNISQNIIYENIGRVWWHIGWYGGEGIHLSNAFNNRIQNNQILNNENHAFYLQGSNDNYIIDNYISGNAGTGIDLHDSNSNRIQGNQISNNQRGINLEWSPENILLNNLLKNNGLVIGKEDFFTYVQTEIANNTVNDKPLIYWLNVSDETVEDAGQIILLGCNNILISNQNIFSASVGILIYSSTNISIQNNTISNNFQNGLLLREVRNCTISSNNLTHNGNGIEIRNFGGLKIVDNIIQHNQEIGIRVEYNEIEPFEHNGHGYQLITNEKTWKEAKTDCEARGGHLVTITSQEENNIVTSLTGGNNVWIGLTDENMEDDWEWITGETVTYTNWDSGEPNDVGGEDYTELYSDGEWNDLPEQYSLYYVCEWEEFNPSKIRTSISRNLVKNNTQGIYLRYFLKSQITDNVIIDNSQNGLDIVDTSLCNISSNEVVNNGGGIRVKRSGFNTIVNNTFIGDGLIIEGWDSVHYTQVAVENNSVNGRGLVYLQNISNKIISEDSGQIILLDCNNISVLNQNLSFASRGVFGYNCLNIVLTKSILINNSDCAIFFQRSRDSVISNNFIKFNRQAIQINELNNFTVANNTILMNQEGGIELHWSFGYLTTGCTITNNIVINSSRGIDLRGFPLNSIRNNTIINNSECGMRILDTKENNITENKVIRNGGGIELESWGNNKIINNTIIGHGLDIQEYSSSQFRQEVIEGNTVNGKPLIYWQYKTDLVIPEDAGQIFLIDVQRITVSNVNIDSVYSSINLRNSNDVMIQNSCFSNNSRTAILVENTVNYNIIGNDISQNDQGIEVHESNHNLIDNNTIRNNRQTGITLRDSQDNTISKNVITNNQGNGIEVGWNTPDTRILENIIHNNFGQGIFVGGSSVTTITNNSILNHSSEGIFLDDSNDCTISNNTIANNQHGINVRWRTNYILIENNKIQNNSQNGIEIFESHSPSILNNLIQQNNYTGIFMQWETNGAVLSNNIIQNNHGSGIYATESHDTVIIGNKIQNNCLSNPFMGAIQLEMSSQYTIQQNKLTNNGIAILVINSVDNSVEENIIQNNYYGLLLNPEVTNTIIKKNDFISNLRILQILGLETTVSQVFDNGSENTFIFNHYSDWATPDEDGDGYVDLPYLINGSSQNRDLYPLVYPNPPRTHRIFGIEVLYPNGGESVRRVALIEWKEPFDSFDFPIYYFIYYSENGGEDWIELEESTRTLYTLTFIYWNTSECYDGPSYLIKVVAYAADGVSEEDISDSTFSVINGITRIPPPSPPPPLALRILLFVIFLTFLAGLIKRGYGKTS